MRKLILAAILILAIFLPSAILAQDLFSATDLSKVRVDNLSGEDISKIKLQLQRNNMSVEQVEPLVLSKGMSVVEFAKLKARLANGSSMLNQEDNVPANQNNNSQLRTQEAIVNDKTPNQADSRIFGSELFDSPTLNFEPNLKLATPLNYILGPGDEMAISVYGVQEFSATVPVSVEGSIAIQYVGQVNVAGMTIEAATQKIKNAVARIYSTVRSGQSKVGVSLSRIRTIKVTLIGSKQPGNYSISSLSTVYNALFLGGGPANNGSYRNIELLRNNKVIANIDIYKFLVNGDQSDNVGLKDNDVIRIPAATRRVTLNGQVNRPGIFEMKAGETFTDLLSYASGFTDIAYTASVNVTQKTDKEFRVKDLKKEAFGSYQPLAGDDYKIAEILNRFENRIRIEGAVFRPDTYSFQEGMRISDLVARADGLKEDAYSQRATIIRMKPDLTREMVNVDLSKALSGDRTANIELKKEDIVTVYSVLEFKEAAKVTINGEIKNPGEYEFRDNLTLNDLFLQAGGLLGSASKRVEIARMRKAEEMDEKNPRKVELFNLEINSASNEQLKNFNLLPFDIVSIRRLAVYEKPEMVFVKGQVAYPGMYVLANKNEKLYDVIMRAGGLTEVADANGVKIKRPTQARQIEALETINLNLSNKDSSENSLTRKLREEITYATIPVEWSKIVADTSNYSNITLLPGDEIDVAVHTQNVKVLGNVILTSEIPYTKGKGFNHYLDAVGGMDSKGWKKKSYVIYPNGKAAVTSSFLFFRVYPKITPGSQLVIPEKPDTKKATIGEIISIASVLVGMAGIVIAVLR